MSNILIVTFTLAIIAACSTVVLVDGSNSSLFRPSQGSLIGSSVSGPRMTSWQGSLYVSAGQTADCAQSSSGYLSWSTDNGQTWQNYSVDPTNDWACGNLVNWKNALYSISGTRCNIGFTSYVYKATFPSQGNVTWAPTTQGSQPWAGRSDMGTVVKQYPIPSVYLFGGTTAGVVWGTNDVWVSNSSDLSVWARKPDAPWPLMSRFAYSLTQTERVVVCGGWNPQTQYVYDTVWISNIDLSSWSQLPSASTSWFARFGAGLVLSGNNLFLMGGAYKLQGSSSNHQANDVWVSNDEGFSWMLVTSSAGFSPRENFASIAIGNSIVLAGGINNGGRFNDVWAAYV